MPIPNVYTATEDPTSQVGNNGDIYFHTGLIGLSAINVYKKVNGRWGLTGSISTGDGALLSANVARVDPGSNGSGKVGDLSKPFLTVQAAIDAIETLNPIPSQPVIDIGVNSYSEDVTTTLATINFIGAGGHGPNISDDESAPSAFQSLTASPSGNNFRLYLCNVGIGDDTSHQNLICSKNLTLYLGPGASVNDVTVNSGNTVNILGQGTKYNQTVTGTVTATGGAQLQDAKVNNLVAGTGAVTLLGCELNFLQSASSANLTDSRIKTNNAGIIPIYDDVMLNPARMDFSTLPTSQPSEVGKAWIDTTGGFNIVKVKL